MAWFGSKKDDMKVKDTSEPCDPVYPWQKCSTLLWNLFVGIYLLTAEDRRGLSVMGDGNMLHPCHMDSGS